MAGAGGSLGLREEGVEAACAGPWVTQRWHVGPGGQLCTTVGRPREESIVPLGLGSWVPMAAGKPAERAPVCGEGEADFGAAGLWAKAMCRPLPQASGFLKGRSPAACFQPGVPRSCHCSSIGPTLRRCWLNMCPAGAEKGDWGCRGPTECMDCSGMVREHLSSTAAPTQESQSGGGVAQPCPSGGGQGGCRPGRTLDLGRGVLWVRW